MTRILMASLILATLAGCEKYTEKTSPCFGRNGAPIAIKAAFTPELPRLVAAGKKERAHDCQFQVIGVSA